MFCSYCICVLWPCVCMGYEDMCTSVCVARESKWLGRFCGFTHLQCFTRNDSLLIVAIVYGSPIQRLWQLFFCFCCCFVGLYHSLCFYFPDIHFLFLYGPWRVDQSSGLSICQLLTYWPTTSFVFSYHSSSSWLRTLLQTPSGITREYNVDFNFATIFHLANGKKKLQS